MGWGAVEASSVVTGTPDERFSEFLTALRARRLVPLLGAGVSGDSVPTTACLMGRLTDRLFSHFWGSETPAGGDFARLAQVVMWQSDPATVCNLLGIADWAKIAPTRAHRYLALLACEGLITDVITTNYDCGLETAWKQARGDRADVWQAIARVEDLSRPHPRGSEARLRLYKINGCAGNLPEAPDEIQLTDLQLQRFGKRRWAGDLIRVLLRERSFVLSGFGSEEPQIWHVVMDILQEFAERASSTSTSMPALSTPALWVAEYSQRIGFHILQALVEEGRIRHNRYRLSGFDNVFSGNDAAFFRPGGSGLDAGDFWRRVWIQAIREGLREEDGQVFGSFFRFMTGRRYRKRRPEDGHFLTLWQSVVDNAFGKEGLPSCPTPGRGGCRGWLSEPVRDGGTGSRWAKSGESPPEKDGPCAPYLTCVPETGDGGWRYLTLHEEPEYWVTLLLLLLVCRETCETGRLEAEVKDSEPLVRVSWGGPKEGVTGQPSVAARDGPVLRRGKEDPSAIVLLIHLDLPRFLHENWLGGGAEAKTLEHLRTDVRLYLRGKGLHASRGREREWGKRWRLNGETEIPS